MFQVAAHTDVVPLEQLYSWCETARDILTGEHPVGRVIARPFRGEPGALERTEDRRDLTLPPPGETVCDRLTAAGIPVKGVGKIADLFADRGISESHHTGGNEATLDAVIRLLDEPTTALVFANLVDFDQRYGHRGDVGGYARALGAFDRSLPRVCDRLGDGDRVLVTADHGTDPTFPGDHTRERTPLLAWGPDLPAGVDLGVRPTYADVGATVLAGLGQSPILGRSFAERLW